MTISEKEKLKIQRKKFIILLFCLIVIDTITSQFLFSHIDKIGGFAPNGEIKDGKYYVLSNDNEKVEVTAFKWYLNTSLFTITIILSFTWGIGGVIILFALFLRPFFFPNLSIGFRKRYKKPKDWKCSNCGTKNSVRFNYCYKCKETINDKEEKH